MRREEDYGFGHSVSYAKESGVERREVGGDGMTVELAIRKLSEFPPYAIVRGVAAGYLIVEWGIAGEA